MWEILNNNDKQIPIPQKGGLINNLENKIINSKSFNFQNLWTLINFF
jgi:hypothetical protein